VVRSLLIFKLGVWTGVAAAAVFVRRAVPSRGDAESDEVALVAAFNGIDLKSRSKAFRGGSMLALFGGIAVDLREAELAPDARLSLRTLLGGIAIRTPPGWRIESSVDVVLGGVDTSKAPEDPDAPVLTLDGVAVLGGIAVGAKSGPDTDS
jgi:hypothetical protein